MRLVSFLGLTAAAALVSPTAAAASGAVPTDRIRVAPMKTSIYIGRVTLTPGVFERRGNTYRATYQAKVWPWFFWGEEGSVTITVPPAELQRLARGETIEFAGSGLNEKGRPRPVTGRVVPVDRASGKIKIRINADGLDLIFNGRYHFGGG